MVEKKTFADRNDEKESSPETQKVRELNDNLRIYGQGGQIVATQGFHSLGEVQCRQIFETIRSFDDFNSDNDPYGEHDFGSVIVDGIKCFWKIDYYDQSMMYHSPDKSDPNVTRRVMTIMLAEEY